MEGQPSEKVQIGTGTKSPLLNEINTSRVTFIDENPKEMEVVAKIPDSIGANVSELPKENSRSGVRLVKEQPPGELKHPYNVWNKLWYYTRT